jgi:hypothetical protein
MLIDFFSLNAPLLASVNPHTRALPWLAAPHSILLVPLSRPCVPPCRHLATPLHTRDHAALATSSNCLATFTDLARIKDVPYPEYRSSPATLPPANDDYEPLLHHAPPSQTTPIPWLAPATTTTAAWGRDPAQHDTIPGLPGHAYSPPGQQGPILRSMYSWNGAATNMTCPMTNVAQSRVLPY